MKPPFSQLVLARHLVNLGMLLQLARLSPANSDLHVPFSGSMRLQALCGMLKVPIGHRRETDGTPTDMPPCSIMSSSLHGHIPSASRNLHVSVSDASAAAAKGMAAITAGSSALLLHITEGDNPESAHQRLSTVLKSFGTGVKVSGLLTAQSQKIFQLLHLADPSYHKDDGDKGDLHIVMQWHMHVHS